DAGWGVTGGGRRPGARTERRRRGAVGRGWLPIRLGAALPPFGGEQGGRGEMALELGAHKTGCPSPVGVLIHDLANARHELVQAGGRDGSAVAHDASAPPRRRRGSRDSSPQASAARLGSRSARRLALAWGRVLFFVRLPSVVVACDRGLSGSE